MIYLMEFEGYDPALPGVVTERFATDGYTTRPGDTPSNAHFEERTISAGSYERSLFSTGRTSGAATVSFGFIELAIGDDGSGGTLDRIARYAVDGRPLRIWALDTVRSPWASRVPVFVGTMEQIEFDWSKATIRIRDRLAELQTSIQTLKYAGTTVAGGMNEAEGTADDLKDRPKPLLFGAARNIPAVLANRYDLIYQVTSGQLAAVTAVRDMGVPLTFSANYASVATLRAASIPAGGYATCLALGLIRTATTPVGDLTVDAAEGAAGQRSAGRTVRRVLQAAGMVADDDFLVSDIEALHAANAAEVGLWLDTSDIQTLECVSTLLDAVGASVVPDRLGVFRVRRLDVPSGAGPILDTAVILDRGEGLARQATGDDGRGVPAAKITLRYGRSYTVQAGSSLDQTAATAELKSFVAQEYRSAIAESATVRAVHLLPAEMEFDTALNDAAAALAEAQRRLTLYGVRRDRYKAPIKTEIAADIDLGDIVTLRVPRFDLAGGKPFAVIGMVEDLSTGVTTLDIYG